ncbi:Hypothetical protein OINT_1002469 [Brucella intermedia LMG 3301]|uniref:Uncharacterized protein n=1 Tax=Brucella intermedia LMG 3301 TaxID=641118 RepID=C4WKQ2_9HYPH|nr:Hypothetical protein OINT_1002469 [Brucella intermedia LMG 3301]
MKSRNLFTTSKSSRQKKIPVWVGWQALVSRMWPDDCRTVEWHALFDGADHDQYCIDPPGMDASHDCADGARIFPVLAAWPCHARLYPVGVIASMGSSAA